MIPSITPASITLTNHVIIPEKDKTFSPILLPVVLHDLPWGHAKKLKQFKGERGYSAEEHLEWFSDWINLEEINHEDIKVGLFSQSLVGEERKWYKTSQMTLS